MLTFLGVALLVYGAMHAYALGLLWRAAPHTPALAAALVLAGLLLTASPLLPWALERQGWHRATAAAAWLAYGWMGYLFLFVCIGLLADLAHALALLLGLRWPLGRAGALAFTGLAALAVLAYGVIAARQPQVSRVEIATPKLTGGPITIAQVSDLHLGAMAGAAAVDRVVATLRQLAPDVVVATGDIVDGQGDDLDALAERLRAYTPPLGAFAVIGNHEQYAGLAQALRFLQRAGYTVLRGEAARVGGIVIVGVDDRWAGAPAQAPDSTPAAPRPAMPAGEGARAFTVLLKHQPIVDATVPFDLQLSGHTHGGQIFPFGLLTRLVYHVHSGLNELPDGRRLYVSRGTGTWGPPLRVLAAPEIVLVTIRAGG